MKKNYFFTGIVCLAIGILFGIITWLTDTKLESILWGFTGGGLGGGGMLLWKYFYWTRPNNKDKYTQRLENESIELHDERKEQFRNQSGRYAYILGLFTVSLSILVFSVLSSFEIIQHAKVLILYLAVYLVFQYVAGVLIFRYLNNKY